MSSGKGHAIRFGVFEVDLDTGELRKQGLRIKLRDNCFMGIERNRDILFGFGREAALRDTFVTAAARNLSCQILLQLQYPQRRV
jgi:hypothetical protein